MEMRNRAGNQCWKSLCIPKKFQVLGKMVSFLGRNKELWPVLLHRASTPNRTIIFNKIPLELPACKALIGGRQGHSALGIPQLLCLHFPGFAGSSSASTSFPPPGRKERDKKLQHQFRVLSCHAQNSRGSCARSRELTRSHSVCSRCGTQMSGKERGFLWRRSVVWRMEAVRSRNAAGKAAHSRGTTRTAEHRPAWSRLRRQIPDKEPALSHTSSQREAWGCRNP